MTEMIMIRPTLVHVSRPCRASMSYTLSCPVLTQYQSAKYDDEEFESWELAQLLEGSFGTRMRRIDQR